MISPRRKFNHTQTINQKTIETARHSVESLRPSKIHTKSIVNQDLQLVAYKENSPYDGDAQSAFSMQTQIMKAIIGVQNSPLMKQNTLHHQKEASFEGDSKV